MRVYFWIAVILVTISIYLVMSTKTKVDKMEQGMQNPLVDPTPVKREAYQEAYVPRVYELLYYQKNSSNEWTFLRNGSSSVEQLLKDVKDGRINILMIYGSIYNVKYLNETATSVILELKSACDTVFFSQCQQALSVYTDPSQYAQILHVLGYFAR